MPRPLTITIFLLIVSGILYLANLAVYEAMKHAFALSGNEPAVLGYALAVLSASFIVSTFIGMRFYNLFTRVYYVLSAVWAGALLYFFLASLAFGIIVALEPCYAAIGRYLFFAAILASMYAVVHARRIKIRHLSVSLPNLPASWKGRRAAWISDVHLGQVHGFDFSEEIVRRVTRLSPDIIFVGGDLYDGTGAPDIPELTSPLKKLAAPLGIYFITGNHEEYGNLQLFLAAAKSVGMRVLMDEMTEVDGLQLLGVDYKNAADRTRFADILSKLPLDRDKPSILLKHEPEDLDIAQEAGISLQISGHTHNAQLWPLTYIASLTYDGFAYGYKRFESVQVYISSGTGTWGPPMRLGTDSEIALVTFV